MRADRVKVASHLFDAICDEFVSALPSVTSA